MGGSEERVVGGFGSRDGSDSAGRVESSVLKIGIDEYHNAHTKATESHIIPQNAPITFSNHY